MIFDTHFKVLKEYSSRMTSGDKMLFNHKMLINLRESYLTTMHKGNEEEIRNRYFLFNGGDIDSEQMGLYLDAETYHSLYTLRFLDRLPVKGIEDFMLSDLPITGDRGVKGLLKVKSIFLLFYHYTKILPYIDMNTYTAGGSFAEKERLVLDCLEKTLEQLEEFIRDKK